MSNSDLSGVLLFQFGIVRQVFFPLPVDKIVLIQLFAEEKKNDAGTA